MDDSAPKASKTKVISRDSVNMGTMLLSSLNKLRTVIEQAFICALLLTATISAAVYGYEKLVSSGNISGIPYVVWQISLIATAFIISLIVAIGLPILWGRSRGFKRILGILSWEFILIAVAVLITAFVLNSNNRNNGSGCIDLLDSDSSCINPGGTFLPTQQ